MLLAFKNNELSSETFLKTIYLHRTRRMQLLSARRWSYHRFSSVWSHFLFLFLFVNVNIEPTRPIRLRFIDPIELPLSTGVHLQTSPKYFTIGEEDDSPSMHFTVLEFALVPNVIVEDYESLSVKSVILELSVVFELVVSKYPFLPLTLLKITLKVKMRTILLTRTVENTILELSTVVGRIVNDCYPVTIWLVFVEHPEICSLTHIVLSIALLLFQFVQIPSKNCLTLTCYFCFFQLFFVLFSHMLHLSQYL